MQDAFSWYLANITGHQKSCYRLWPGREGYVWSCEHKDPKSFHAQTNAGCGYTTDQSTHSRNFQEVQPTSTLVTRKWTTNGKTWNSLLSRCTGRQGMATLQTHYNPCVSCVYENNGNTKTDSVTVQYTVLSQLLLYSDWGSYKLHLFPPFIYSFF